jgi:hypothetical protein
VSTAGITGTTQATPVITQAAPVTTQAAPVTTQAAPVTTTGDGPSGAATGSPGLAYTGDSRYVLWLVIAGTGLILMGEGGRRMARARQGLLTNVGLDEVR